MAYKNGYGHLATKPQMEKTGWKDQDGSTQLSTPFIMLKDSGPDIGSPIQKWSLKVLTTYMLLWFAYVVHLNKSFYND
jgi:hypothetical protein